MIDLLQGGLIDLLPVQWKTEETDAISYALQWGTQLLVSLAKQTRLRADVDTLPERILDITAVEMQAPYYSETLPIETKREIIKRTVRWHMHAGTPAAVEELLEVVFGSGEVIENWDFEDPAERLPYTFDIATNAPLRPDTYGHVMSMLDRVKNARSHLRSIVYKVPLETILGIGLSSLSVPVIKSRLNFVVSAPVRSDSGIGMSVMTQPTLASQTAWQVRPQLRQTLAAGVSGQVIPVVRSAPTGQRISAVDSPLRFSLTAKTIPVRRSECE